MFIHSTADTFLQVYLSILYLRIPQAFKIMLRGKVVQQHNVADDLKHPQYILYKPQVAGREEVRKISGLLLVLRNCSFPNKNSNLVVQ